MMLTKNKVIFCVLFLLMGLSAFSYDEAHAMKVGGDSLNIEFQSLNRQGNQVKINDFIAVVKSGDVKTARTMIESGYIETNSKDELGLPAMYYAILHTHQIEMIKLLKEAGATIDPKWFIEVVRQNNQDNQSLEVVKLLVSYGVDVNYKNESGFSAMYYAILHNNQIEMVKLLKGAGANIEGDWFVQSVRQNNFYNNYEAMVRLLLSYKLDVNQKNESGFPAIYYAILYNNQTEMVKLLRQNGAKIEPGWFVQAVQKNNDDNNYEEMVKLLLSYGINVNHKNEFGLPAIYYAVVDKNQLNIVRLLKVAGAGIAPEWLLEVVRLNNDKNNYLDMVQLLLSYEIDVNYKDTKGNSALSIAMDKKQQVLVSRLKDAGATIENETVLVYKNFENKTNVEPKKEWKVKFNFQVDEKFLTTKYVFILDQNGMIMPTETTVDQDQTTILVVPPKHGYENGKTYTLYIKGVRATDGRQLKFPVKMEFTVK